MPESWDYYFCPVDDQPACIFVDLRLERSMPDPRRGWLMRIVIRLQFASQPGEHHELEECAIDALDDAFGEALYLRHQCQLAGLLLTDQHREYFLYAESRAGLEAAVHRIMLQFPLYEYCCTLEKDRNWEVYSGLLYPSDFDLQMIRCRRRMEELLSRGIAAAAPRDLNHVLDFSTDAARGLFVQRILQLGLKVKSIHAMLHDSSDLPCRLHLVRSDRLEPRRLEAVVTTLFLNAQEFGGAYQGWQPADAESPSFGLPI